MRLQTVTPVRERRSIVIVLLTASLLAAALGRGVSPAFEPARIKVVRGPAPAARVFAAEVPDTPLRNRLTTVFALIARVSNPAGGPASFRISLDGRLACEESVAGRAASRIDCHVAVPASAIVTIEGPATFSVDYLELATHHGSTVWPHRIYVTPARTELPRHHPAVPATAWTLLVLLGIRFWQPLPTPRRRWLHRIGMFVGLSFLALVALAPLALPFAVVISAGGWCLWAALLMWPAISAAARAVAARVEPRTLAVAGVLLISTIVIARVVDSARTLLYEGNYSGFVHINRGAFDAHPMLGARDDIRASLRLEPGGYDGQFVYFMTFDPFIRDWRDPHIVGRYIDTPPYRYGRAGFAWLTKLVSLGRWQLVPTVMVWLVAAGIAGTAALMTRFARDGGVSAWWGLSVLAIPGMWRSLHVALPEPIAAMLVLGGLLLFKGGRMTGAALAFSAAMLVRETTVVPVLVCVVFLSRDAGVRRAIAFAALAILPYLLWRAYVGFAFLDDWGLRGFLFNPGTHGVPLAGIAGVYRDVSAGLYSAHGGLVRAAIWLPPLLAAISALAIALAIRCRSVAAISAAIYAVAALSLDRLQVWSHAANVERTTYELFVLAAAACLTLPREATRLRAAGIAVLIVSVLYLLFGTYDASFFRGAVFSVGL